MQKLIVGKRSFNNHVRFPQSFPHYATFLCLVHKKVRYSAILSKIKALLVHNP
jgi:hypothetical protein